MARADTVEVAAVGKEDLAAGLAAARTLPSFELLVQVPGKAVRIERERAVPTLFSPHSADRADRGVRELGRLLSHVTGQLSSERR